MARLTERAFAEMAGPIRDGEHCGSGLARILAERHAIDFEALFRAEFWDGKPKRPVPEIAEAICERLGWPETGEAAEGDVGVYGDTLALCVGRWWAVRTPKGLGFVSRVDRMWRPT